MIAPPSRPSSMFLGTLLLAVLAVAATQARAEGAAVPWRTLAAEAPGANPQAIRLALDALRCAATRGVPSPRRLGVIDYALPSTRRRLWIFDLRTRRLLMRERVAHGRNSGGNEATRFSNRDGSLESSLGLYRTLGTYQGDNGYSLRLQGLDPGFNDNALERAIVIHGASYVSKAFAQREGRIGRSWGCPAVSTRVATRVINSLKDGQMVFAFYPERSWLDHSRLLHCSMVHGSLTRAEPARRQAGAARASAR